MNAYHHGGSQAAAYGYMDPQYAQHGYTPAYRIQSQQQVPHQVTSTIGPWGRHDIAGFTRSCSSVTPLNGRNLSEFKFHFMTMCRSFALRGFLEDPAPWGNGFAFPANEPAPISETIQYSTVVYLGMLMCYTDMVKFKIKPFVDGHYQAAETWNFMHKEYASEVNLGQNDLIRCKSSNSY